jgi:F-type H+-transporting ATPase subunit c
MKTFKMMGLLGIALVVVLLGPATLLAQDEYAGPPQLQNTTLSGAAVGAGLGMALTIIGAGYGLGRIGSAALESMARQPGAAGNIQTAMIIVAAMLEGATLASVILCYLVGLNATF